MVAYAPQQPQRILQSFIQCCEALGIADGAGLPVRMRQHEVIQHVRERLVRDRDSKLSQMREVGCAQLARPVFLREEYFLRRSLRGAPVFHFPLEGSQLAVGKTVRVSGS
jgi:hypothetical protein